MWLGYIQGIPAEFLFGNLLENVHLEDEDGNGKMTLRWIEGRVMRIRGEW
jgi:hypothetical protein